MTFLTKKSYTFHSSFFTEAKKRGERLHILAVFPNTHKESKPLLSLLIDLDGQQNTKCGWWNSFVKTGNVNFILQCSDVFGYITWHYYDDNLGLWPIDNKKLVILEEGVSLKHSELTRYPKNRNSIISSVCFWLLAFKNVPSKNLALGFAWSRHKTMNSFLHFTGIFGLSASPCVISSMGLVGGLRLLLLLLTHFLFCFCFCF